VSRSGFGPEAFQAATNVSRETLDRLIAYAVLLERWSGALNLVGRATLRDLWRRHMLDSAQLYPLLPPVLPATGGRERVVVDLGSGAGFPGLVLAIMGGGQVHLIEADRKKAEFLREAARVAGATVSIHAQRIEDVAPIPAHAVTARALAPLPRLLAYAAPFLSAPRPPSAGGEGIALFLKGRTLDRELTDSTPVWTMDQEILPSRTEPAGRILRLRRLQRGNPRT